MTWEGDGEPWRPTGEATVSPVRQPVCVDAAAAVATAYHQDHRAVYGLAARLCGPSAAEDVTQEVFLQFWRAPKRYMPERGSLRTFLLTMAHNRSVDVLRSTESRRRREGRSAIGAEATSADVEGQIEEFGDDRHIRLALDGLPPREKEAIVTVFYGSRTYREAAFVLRVSEGTTKSRIRSGLRRLALTLEESASVGS